MLFSFLFFFSPTLSWVKRHNYIDKSVWKTLKSYHNWAMSPTWVMGQNELPISQMNTPSKKGFWFTLINNINSMLWIWVIYVCCKTTIKARQDSSLWGIEIWGIREKHFRNLTWTKHCHSSVHSRPTTIKGNQVVTWGFTKRKLEDILLKLFSYSYNISILLASALTNPRNGVEVSYGCIFLLS